MKKEATKVLIIEDEPIISSDIEMTLEELGYEITSIEDNGNDALESISSTPPDIVLLDINLEGDMDGIMVAEEINERFKIPFIFLTSNADKLTINRVKKTKPAGFIVKPYNDKDLQSNIEIALFSSQTDDSSTSESQSFFVKDGTGLVQIDSNDILFIQADDNYCRIYTNEKTYLITSTLKKVLAKLNSNEFLRIHRSYIIQIKSIEKIKNSYVYIKNHQIPIGRSYNETLFESIDKL